MSGPVMIVEDDADVRDALAEILEDNGYSVVSAANGLQALAALQQGPCPSLILLDLMMPEMDGFEFRAAQQRSKLHAAIPVVVISAVRDAVPKASKLEAAAALRKPIRLEALLEVVARLTA